MKFVRGAVLLAFAPCVGSTHAQTRVVKNDTQIDGLDPGIRVPGIRRSFDLH